MWDPDVGEYISALQDLSLLEEKTEDRFVLTPFLLSYIEASIEPLTKETCLKHICHYYLNMMSRSYRTICRVPDSTDATKLS